uniref:DNA polymerase epsilon catalytic subunit n=1 Tax=Tanacetum cinerariifolium TaxID=118510 RepID=A0A6L2K0P3_TANCI|nr:DNA polymerase epsilon catalytic subunit A-like [Tanacetum cinerariifolium]
MAELVARHGVKQTFMISVTSYVLRVYLNPMEVKEQDLHFEFGSLVSSVSGAYDYNYQAEHEKFYNGHLLGSETYIGGHVECLETGVFRSDLPTCFKLDSSAFDGLIEILDCDLLYAIRVEGKMDVESVSNYDEVKNAIMEKLIMLRDEPTREECSLIYHLDVAAMYPNIILTNRLQDLNYCCKTLWVNHNESLCYFGSKDMRAHL